MSSDTTGISSPSGGCPAPIRRASSTDIPALASLLGRTLADDPLLRWIFPKDSRRRKNAVRDFARLLKPRIRDGVVTTIDGKSVAVWTPPNPPQQTLWEKYGESFYRRRVHGRRIHLVRNCFQRMAERHPTTPHWYLLALATEDTCRGQGLASRLLKERFLRCDEEGQTVVLETSKESNLAYYEKFGFAVTDELLIDEGVRTWLMVREGS